MRASSRAHRARPILKALDATYRERAIPPGSARHWSWLFAATEARAPLLGIYALLAEWQALMDPATEASVAHLKLAWWGEEIQRLKRGSAVHPISSYLAALPRAAVVDFEPLLVSVAAAATQVGGAPVERGADLEWQCRSLYGGPLTLASRLAADVADVAAVGNCTQALAAGEYLAKALRDYRREAGAGRVPFAIDELLAAGIDNDDLAAAIKRLDPRFERRRLPQVERIDRLHVIVAVKQDTGRFAVTVGCAVAAFADDDRMAFGWAHAGIKTERPQVGCDIFGRSAAVRRISRIGRNRLNPQQVE